MAELLGGAGMVQGFLKVFFFPKLFERHLPNLRDSWYLESGSLLFIIYDLLINYIHYYDLWFIIILFIIVRIFINYDLLSFMIYDSGVMTVLEGVI